MIVDADILEAAHLHCACHRGELQASEVCGCFSCCATFPPSEIAEWIEETGGEFSRQPDPWTALCPKCGIDAVIGSASKLPADDPGFLSAMQTRWFG